MLIAASSKGGSLAAWGDDPKALARPSHSTDRRGAQLTAVDQGLNLRHLLDGHCEEEFVVFPAEEGILQRIPPLGACVASERLRYWQPPQIENRADRAGFTNVPKIAGQTIGEIDG
jgi:hypothetical protein